MSTYMQLFVRKDDTFIELYSFSRSTVLYRVFEYYLPCMEKIKLITDSLLDTAFERIESDLEHRRNSIERECTNIEHIKTMSGDLKERLELIEDAQCEIVGMKDDIAEIEYTKVMLEFIRRMVRVAALNEKYEENSPAVKFYLGIECGSNVTKEDIIE